jgi:leucyl/phenylalanyl-tRNA--protein transferase
MPVFKLSDKLVFPPPHLATKEGLLAIGGDLNRKRLLLAYRMGIFPWYSKGNPILWWSTDPRLVLYPGEFHISRSLRRVIRKQFFRITMDKVFDKVIFNCANSPRKIGTGTWIRPEMIEAYCDLFNAGYAHSVEAWHEENLVGGLYGVSIGGCFFGESMFSNKSNASKVCLAYLSTYLRIHSFDLIDCQVKTDHLVSLGAREIPRKDFLKQLYNSLKRKTFKGRWKGLEGFR